jgi:hypothetical protein
MRYVRIRSSAAAEESQKVGRFSRAETGTVFGTVGFLDLEPRRYLSEKALRKSMVGVTEFRSSRQDCSAGESPAASVARVGCEAIPRPGAGNQPGGRVV